MKTKRIARPQLLWLVLIAAGLFSMMALFSDSGGSTRIDTSAALQLISEGKVDTAKVLNNERLELVLKDGVTYSDGAKVKDATKVYTYYVEARGPQIVAALDAHKPAKGFTDQIDQQNWFTSMLGLVLPMLLVLGLFWFLMGQMQGGGNRVMQFGKSRAKLATKDMPKVTFQDVAGCDEAVEELHEIKEFLQEPAKFLAVGAKIPKGVLLYGPPGTGKTLLARAVAGEAGVPFYSISGSDFVEMFVGVGASRVRDLFEQAKANAPAIVFVDEIDAVGRHRGAGLGGGHDEREQTLNQLLVEMDGFESNDGVILVAATNRPDVLDPALMRPGRFDRQIVVDMPDLQGREAILKVHMKKIKAAADVSLRKIAAGSPGLAGADLANLVNEAALLAARKNHLEVTMDDFWDAREKVMLGPERRSRLLTDEDKRITAYHESGHAVIAELCEHAQKTEKVTIIPRGRTLGVTWMLPEKDDVHMSRAKYLDFICVSLGGRVAEEIFIGSITSGAYADIRTVSSLAREMVTRVGMSDALGPICFEEGEEQVFLGRDFARRKTVSERTLQVIDDEISRIVSEQLERTRLLLRENTDKVETMAAALLDRETLTREEVQMIMQGRPLPPPRLDPALYEEPASTADGDGEGAATTVPGNNASGDPAVESRNDPTGDGRAGPS